MIPIYIYLEGEYRHTIETAIIPRQGEKMILTTGPNRILSCRIAEVYWDLAPIDGDEDHHVHLSCVRMYLEALS